MMFNETLARETLSEIDRDQTRWAQGSWVAPIDVDTFHDGRFGHDENVQDDPVTVCGAKLCFAGHAALLAGYMLHRTSFDSATMVDPSTGETVEIMDAAARELGIANGTELFAADNDRDDLQVGVDSYAAGMDEYDTDRAIAESRGEYDEYDDCDCDMCVPTDDEDELAF